MIILAPEVLRTLLVVAPLSQNFDLGYQCNSAYEVSVEGEGLSRSVAASNSLDSTPEPGS